MRLFDASCVRTYRDIASPACFSSLARTSSSEAGHTGYLELRTDDSGSEDDLGGRLSVGANVEHGEARALAPVYLGPASATTRPRTRTS